MKRHITISLLALFLGVASSVQAEEKVSIKEKEARTWDEQQLTEVATATNEACGTKIAASIDWASFKGVDRAGNSLSGYCASPLNSLASLCGASAAGKEAVQKDVKKLVCHYGAKDKPVLTVKDGTVHWTISWGLSNLEDFAKDYFENNL